MMALCLAALISWLIETHGKIIMATQRGQTIGLGVPVLFNCHA